MKTSLNVKFVMVMTLVNYGVLARNTDNNRHFSKETTNKNYGGSMLMEIAKELVQRSTSSSQVSSILFSLLASEYFTPIAINRVRSDCNNERGINFLNIYHLKFMIFYFQVLNLNLSNLLLLLVLKAVVFGAGYLGHPGQKGRELEEGFSTRKL